MRQIDLLDELRTAERRLMKEANDLIASGNNRFHDLYRNEAGQIISLQAIERICLNYRLRFLDRRFFKGEVPTAAKDRVERLESEYGLILDKLFVIAPGELFRLERREKDPVLLAELPNGHYLILYKWGGEFSASRKLLSLPLRNIPSMLITTAIFALFCALLFLPFTGGFETPAKVFGFGFMVLWGGFISYTAFISFSQNIFPTSLIWNSRFLD